VVFIDAIVVKVRDGQVVNRPIYVAIGVTCSGERDILGLWAGDGGEGPTTPRVASPQRTSEPPAATTDGWWYSPPAAPPPAPA